MCSKNQVPLFIAFTLSCTKNLSTSLPCRVKLRTLGAPKISAKYANRFKQISLVTCSKKELASFPSLSPCIRKTLSSSWSSNNLDKTFPPDSQFTVHFVTQNTKESGVFRPRSIPPINFLR
ncbi:hypothetical protein WA026_004620 [Henosepilachna vigintioctopunctata]|uniref:Uncharacterized protein n=1 Tax=Henosepilachna vigintioctopunctata TaxID=420089 RepID=A0AAW1V0Z7_9CUCU